ncbi:hypothetical protein DQ04_02441080 [Trypanosoma grayi]|uniref:hypothetical protein n=1 Tax=Trypanosoma grayi TaxID=71804 RepID=UPI0004F3F311|nr:hypothetical protein DQ04_02441080 [Trypanosoma grayi]KEG11619.1 hypothetical protein DQ04_02441080 [Trypanosoma grayi]
MDEKSFTYILTPATSTRECVHRVLCKDLPSLEEAVESSERMSGTWLVERDEFVDEVLSGFDRTAKCRSFSRDNSSSSSSGRIRISTVKEYSSPGGCILPETVEARGNVHSKRVPPFFEEGVWPLVWAQFERDIRRETLLIDGTLEDDAVRALDRIQALLLDAYNYQLPHNTGDAILSTGENPETKGFFSGLFTTARGLARRVQSAYAEMSKWRAVADALRLAVLMSQQTVLALPVEILNAQFCEPSRDSSGSDRGEGQTVYIGEPHVGSAKRGEAPSHPDEEARGRMIVHLARRDRGNRLPFVCVEKSLHVSTVDEAANHSTKLRLWIAVRVDLFTKDHVELNWEWRRP